METITIMKAAAITTTTTTTPQYQELTVIPTFTNLAGDALVSYGPTIPVSERTPGPKRHGSPPSPVSRNTMNNPITRNDVFRREMEIDMTNAEEPVTGEVAYVVNHQPLAFFQITATSLGLWTIWVLCRKTWIWKCFRICFEFQLI